MLFTSGAEFPTTITPDQIIDSVNCEAFIDKDGKPKVKVNVTLTKNGKEFIDKHTDLQVDARFSWIQYQDPQQQARMFRLTKPANDFEQVFDIPDKKKS